MAKHTHSSYLNRQSATRLKWFMNKLTSSVTRVLFLLLAVLGADFLLRALLGAFFALGMGIAGVRAKDLLLLGPVCTKDGLEFFSSKN